MLKKYKLPNGTLFINTSDSTIEHIFDNMQPIEILPGKAYLAGDMRSLPIQEYFASPDIWDAKWEVNQAIEKKGKTVVALDAGRVNKFGDQIMLTVLPKAYCETWRDKAIIDVVISKGFEVVWENNPHVRKVTNKLDESEKYDKIFDVNSFGLKFRRKTEDVHCIDAILNGLGLTLISKTPVLVLTEKEKEWAKEKIKKIQRPLIGISLYSQVKSRTYPHMPKVGEVLKKLGYKVIILDEKNDDKFEYTFREVVALVNECDLIVTTDSAILHVAGALKKRIVGVFGYTDSEILGEAYEKFNGIQAPCPYGKSPCWWKIECLPGNSYQDKMDKDYAHCLKELDSQEIVNKAEEQFTKPKDLLLVMLTYGALDMTKRAIESIRSYHNYSLFVVDNESIDGTQKWLKEQNIDFVSKKTSVAAAQNIGIIKFLEKKYDYLIFLNNDIVLRYDMLDKLVECAKKSGAYGVMGTQRPCSWNIDSAKPENTNWTEIIDIPAGSYSATLFTRECIEKIGTFNERYKPRYIEDNDYTLRIRGNGKKFVRAHAALFWHFLGAVIKTVETDKKNCSKTWNNNINIFQEMYGIHPHEAQDLGKLGLEWHREDWTVKIKDFLRTHNKVAIRVMRRMGGYGDILFTTVVARALKFLFKDKIEINYFVPEEFVSLLKYNSNIDSVYDWHNSWKGDFRIDLTDLEFRVELQEMREFGTIKSARTEIYLDVLGLSKHLPKGDWLKPDYFVTGEEKEWAEKQWQSTGKPRIVWVMKGSNKLKEWPYMQKLFDKIAKEKRDVANCVVYGSAGQSEFSFRQSAALVATADLVISPDSGISNLAGTLGIPAMTIFSNRNKDNFVKMYKSMTGIQGDCPHRKENYCDFFCLCLGDGPHRAKENIRIPDCLKRLKTEKVYEKKELL